MRKFLLFFIFIFPIIAFSQTSKDTIFSQKLKEDREFRISLPESYATNKTKKYPILLLLDGDYYISTCATSTLEYLKKKD
jgi:predicted alpha/beta superfamily hydrolase